MADMANVPVRNGQNYQEKLSNVVQDSLNKWFKGLSKEELLQYIADRPAITADMLRDMMQSYDMTIGFGTMYNTVQGQTSVFFEQKEA